MSCTLLLKIPDCRRVAWLISSLEVRSDSAALRMFVLLFFVLALPSVSAGSPNSQEELRRGAEQFVNLIEAKDVEALLNRFSEQGTSFIGTAYVPSSASLSRDEIRKEFAVKSGIYCLFFDTKCFRDEDSNERSRQHGRPLALPLQSLLDLLAAAKAKKFVTYDTVGNGKVTLLLSDRTPDTARLGQDALNLYFRFEQGEWKLRNVEYN